METVLSSRDVFQDAPASKPAADMSVLPLLSASAPRPQGGSMLSAPRRPVPVVPRAQGGYREERLLIPTPLVGARREQIVSSAEPTQPDEEPGLKPKRVKGSVRRKVKAASKSGDYLDTFFNEDSDDILGVPPSSPPLEPPIQPCFAKQNEIFRNDADRGMGKRQDTPETVESTPPKTLLAEAEPDPQDPDPADMKTKVVDLATAPTDIVKIKCRCGNLLKPDANFCRRCGAKKVIPEAPINLNPARGFCPCGVKFLDDHADICQGCGRVRGACPREAPLGSKCRCGNMLLPDARFCRKCGKPKSTRKQNVGRVRKGGMWPSPFPGYKGIFAYSVKETRAADASLGNGCYLWMMEIIAGTVEISNADDEDDIDVCFSCQMKKTLVSTPLDACDAMKNTVDKYIIENWSGKAEIDRKVFILESIGEEYIEATIDFSDLPLPREALAGTFEMNYPRITELSRLSIPRG